MVLTSSVERLREWYSVREGKYFQFFHYKGIIIPLKQGISHSFIPSFSVITVLWCRLKSHMCQTQNPESST